jgi:hypothetical protein
LNISALTQGFSNTGEGGGRIRQMRVETGKLLCPRSRGDSKNHKRKEVIKR